MIYGIDIGGSKIEIAVYDEGINLQDSWRVNTPTGDYQTFLDTLTTLIIEADQRFDCLGKIGLGMAGLIDKNNLSLSANIAVANGKDIAKDVGDIVGRHITCENDCRCFALSEANGGAGVGYSTVYGAIIGTGAAGGFVIDRKLLKSWQNIAGEYGHLQLSAVLSQKYNLPLRKCGCGLASCYEGYISGPGLQFLHKHFNDVDLSVLDLLNSWRDGDKAAISTIDCYLDLLGACLSNIVLSYDPDIIVLGGGISLIDEFVTAIPQKIENHLFKGYRAPPVVTAKFGDASGTRGAALLARGAANA